MSQSARRVVNYVGSVSVSSQVRNWVSLWSRMNSSRSTNRSSRPRTLDLHQVESTYPTKHTQAHPALEQVCAEPPTPAVSVTLLAIAAAALCCCGAVAAGYPAPVVGAPCSNRLITPSSRAPSSKPAACCCSSR